MAAQLEAAKNAGADQAAEVEKARLA